LDEETINTAAKLQSTRTNEQFLEDISAPRTDSSGQKKTKPLTKKQMRAVERQAEEDAENEDQETYHSMAPEAADEVVTLEEDDMAPSR